MRKFTVMFVAALFIAIAACAWIETNPQTSDAAAKISSRRVGAELQRKYPEIAEPIYLICEAIKVDAGTGSTDALRYRLQELLVQEIDDRLLVADIADLIDLIKIKPDVELTEQQRGLIEIIACGLMDGIDLTRGDSGIG